VSIFSKRLNSARRARGLSQKELAVKTGLRQVAISFFETGRRAPSFENLKRLADGLEVTSDYMMGRSDFPEAFAKAQSRLFRSADKLSARDLEVLRQVAEDLARQKS